MNNNTNKWFQSHRKLYKDAHNIDLLIVIKRELDSIADDIFHIENDWYHLQELDIFKSVITESVTAQLRNQFWDLYDNILKIRSTWVDNILDRKRETQKPPVLEENKINE